MGWVDVSQYGLARIRHIEGSKISNQDISLVAIENVMSATFVHSAHDSYPPAVGNDCGPSNLKRIQTVDYFGPKKTNVLSVKHSTKYRGAAVLCSNHSIFHNMAAHVRP